MHAYVVSEVLEWIVCCIMYDKSKYNCKLVTQCNILPRTSDSTYLYIYKQGLEINTTSLHYYVTSVLNTHLRFGYTL